MNRGDSMRRLRGLIRKEFFQVLRDPSSIAIAFLMPVLLLLLFGYGVSLDARHVPIALVVEQVHQFWPMALIGVVSLSLAGWLFRNRLH